MERMERRATRSLCVILSSCRMPFRGSRAGPLLPLGRTRMLRMPRMLRIVPCGGDVPCTPRSDPHDPLDPEHPYPLQQLKGSGASSVAEGMDKKPQSAVRSVRLAERPPRALD